MPRSFRRASAAAIMAALDAGPAAIFFATTRPAWTGSLILVHTTARYVADGDYPIGIAPAVFQGLLAQVDQLWGSEAMAAMMVPSRAGDARFRRWSRSCSVPAPARGPLSR
jgi:hypothetical protein